MLDPLQGKRLGVGIGLTSNLIYFVAGITGIEFAVQPIPEPSVLVLVLVSGALLGLRVGLRRRSRTVPEPGVL
jgi:hypothetical protein